MYPITLSFTLKSAEELALFHGVLGTPAAASAVVAAPEAPPAKKSSTSAATKAGAAHTPPTVEVAAGTAAPGKTDAAPSHTAGSAEGAPQVSTAATDSRPADLDTVKAEFKAFCAAKGVPAAQEIFAKYGLARLTAAPVDLYPQLIAEFSARD